MEHRGLGSWLVDRPDTHGRQDLSHIARAPKKSCSFLNYLPKYFVILGDCPVASGWWRGEWLTVAQHCHLWTSVPSRATKVAVGPIKENSVMYHRVP